MATRSPRRLLLFRQRPQVRSTAGCTASSGDEQKVEQLTRKSDHKSGRPFAASWWASAAKPAPTAFVPGRHRSPLRFGQLGPRRLLTPFISFCTRAQLSFTLCGQLAIKLNETESVRA